MAAQMAAMMGGGASGGASGASGSAGGAGGASRSRGSRSNFQDVGGGNYDDFNLDMGGSGGKYGRKKAAPTPRGRGQVARGGKPKPRQWWCLFLCRA